jgi:response regulator RpfG family c-di-GMP phosphodiesterase
MGEQQRAVLFVDDEESILTSLRRVLRNEPYRFLAAAGGAEGLQLLRDNEVQVVVSDQRMSPMSGTQFLLAVQEKYPDIVRIVLSGYTEMDTVIEAINRGHIYKFLFKPWKNAQLIVEIRQALEYYELRHRNIALDRKVIEQNSQLQELNSRLEAAVQQRTEMLKLQGEALELAYNLIGALPSAIVGLSADGMVSLVNQAAQQLSLGEKPIKMGDNIRDFFGAPSLAALAETMAGNIRKSITARSRAGGDLTLHFSPLTQGKSTTGAILTITPS